MNKCSDIIVSQGTTQFYVQYVQYISQLHVSAHFSPSSGHNNKLNLHQTHQLYLIL